MTRRPIKEQLSSFIKEWEDSSPLLCVHTSGSTGTPKPLMVEKKRMIKSAVATCDFLGLKQGDSALLCMPLDFIAGKMVVVRTLVRGLKLICVEPDGHPLASLDCAPDFAAMTPMQVFNSLQTDKEARILGKIRHLIIGGGAIDAGMESRLRSFDNNIWSTYGMTETLSHIAMRKLNGNDSDIWYTCFNGVEVSLDDDNCLVINAPEICPDVLKTNDIAVINENDGRQFRILGRRDNTICSGGIKIQIEEVENILREYIKSDFIITKRQDPKFGEIVVLMTTGTSLDDIKKKCESHLPEYWRPRLYATIPQIPLTATGKPARKEAAELAKTL
ncbi:MAG: AMP-binding protein [Prevotella sp.]